MKMKNKKKERRRKLKTHFEQTKILKKCKKKKERKIENIHTFTTKEKQEKN